MGTSETLAPAGGFVDKIFTVHQKIEKYPPFHEAHKVIDNVLFKGHKFWIVEVEGAPLFGQWSSKIICKTMEEAREKLVIL